MTTRPLRYGYRASTERNPGYVSVQFFIGRNEGSRPNVGSILLDPEDWPTMQAVLVRAGFDEAQ